MGIIYGLHGYVFYNFIVCHISPGRLKLITPLTSLLMSYKYLAYKMYAQFKERQTHVYDKSNLGRGDRIAVDKFQQSMPHIATTLYIYATHMPCTRNRHDTHIIS